MTEFTGQVFDLNPSAPGLFSAKEPARVEIPNIELTGVYDNFGETTEIAVSYDLQGN